MTANKEAVLSEKTFRAHFGQTVVVGYSEAIHSGSFDSFDAFAGEVQKQWDAQWERVMSAKREGEGFWPVACKTPIHLSAMLANDACTALQSAMLLPFTYK